MLNLRPKYVLLMVEFQYHSQRTKNVPNSIRQSLLGIKKGSPKFPQEIQKLTGYSRQVLSPVHFALIKKPVTIELTEINVRKTRNAAVGAMVLYEYLGLFQDMDEILKKLDGLISEKIQSGKPAYFGACTEYKIIIGEDLDNIRK